MNKGFTLIELMVSVAIFGFITSIVVGLLIYAITIQRSIIAQQKLLDEASFVMEYMSRGLRFAEKDEAGGCITVGKNYQVLSPGPDLGQEITFLSPDPETAGQTFCRRFFVVDIGGGQLRLKENIDGTTEDFITSSLMKITDFKVRVQGDGADTEQPRVTIMLEFRAIGIRPEQQPSVQLQTTVSQRNLDL